MRALTKPQLKAVAKAHNDAKGVGQDAAKLLGISYGAYRSRLQVARDTLPAKDFKTFEPPPSKNRLDEQVAAEAWAAYEEASFSGTEGARILGVPYSTFRNRLHQARTVYGYKEPDMGQEDALKPRVLPLPAPGEVKRYILTAAQNNTRLHGPTWNAMRALADHYDAQIMISTFMYIHSSQGSAKRGTNKSDRQKDAWYDPAIEPFVCDEYVTLAPGLAWCGHFNISPTAVSPLSGLESYTGRASAIFPHTKVAMESVATIKADAAKFIWTTGAITKRNYIQRSVGIKADFHHSHGGLLVEVNSDGSWFVRQLSSDSKGRIYDAEIVAHANGEVLPHDGAEAIVFGDIHESQLEDEMRQLIWGEGGMVDVLQPAYQVMHDVLDMESRGHHNRRDPHKMFELHVHKRESVKGEMTGVSSFLRDAWRSWGKIVIVDSNHDRAANRWLKEADWRDDPVNAEFYLAAQAAYLQAIKRGQDFNPLKWAVQKYAGVKDVKWLAPGESFVLCRDASGGIECGMHGDEGPNGARGSARNLSRLGRKVCIGHSHSARIVDGAWQSGVTAKLDMSYTGGGPSSWSQTMILVHRNGKRQMLTVWKGAWRAKVCTVSNKAA